MPRILSRLPASFHKFVTVALLVLAVLCSLVAILLFVQYSQTTETSGHLWWKETRAIPLDERRPYLIAGICLIIGAVTLTAGAMELIAAQARREESALPIDPAANSSLPFLFGRALRRHRQRRRVLKAERITAAEAQRAAAQEAAERRRYEMSTAGMAESAYRRGDLFFSIELKADDDLAWHLNQIHAAGWRHQSVSRRHVRTTQTDRGFGGAAEVTRESIEYRAYLFRRDSAT